MHPQPTRNHRSGRLVLICVMVMITASCRRSEMNEPDSTPPAAPEQFAPVLDLSLTEASFEPRKLRTSLAPDQLSFTFSHDRPELAAESIEVEIKLLAHRISETPLQPLVLGQLRGSLSLTNANQPTNLPARLLKNYRFPTGSAGRYRLELQLTDQDTPDPTPTDNAFTFDGEIEVSDWVASQWIVLSDPRPPANGFTPEFAEGAEYNNDYGNSWRFTASPSYMALKFDSETDGSADLTLRHLVSTSRDITPPSTAPLAVLVNGRLIATTLPTRPPSPEQPWTDATVTIPTRRGVNQLDLIAGELATHLWLQAVTITPHSSAPTEVSSPGELSITELDNDRRRILTRLANAHIQSANLDHARMLGELARQSPGFASNPRWQMEDLHLRAQLAYHASNLEHAEQLANDLITHEAISLDPARHFDGWDILSLCYETSHRTDLAISSLKNCIATETDELALRVDIRERLAGQYLRAGQPLIAESWALETQAMIPPNAFPDHRAAIEAILRSIQAFSTYLNPTGFAPPKETARQILDTIANLPLLKKALADAPDLPLNQSIIKAFDASRHFLAGDYEQARLTFLSAIEMLAGSNFPEYRGHLYLNTANCEFRLERWRDSIESLTRAINHYSEAFDTLNHPLVLASTSALSFSAYFQLMRCFQVLDQPASSLLALERGRSRALSALLQNHSNAPTFESSDHTSETEAKKALSRLIKGITRGLPADRRVLFVEYAIGDEASFVFTVKPQGNAPPLIKVALLDENRPQIALLVARLRQRVLGEKDRRNYDEATQLAELLLHPIASDLAELTGDDLLCLIPSDVLWELPFGALPFGGQTLGNRQPLSLAPSLRALSQIRQREPIRGSAKTLALIAPTVPNQSTQGSAEFLQELAPITGTENLVDALTDLAGHSLQIKQGELATETFFKSQLQTAGELLLVTHGVFHPFDADQSGFYLAADATNDGLFTVSEMLAAKLRSDLAFLAACHTGQGKRTPGEGAIGLSWALLAAGSDSNLVTLHQVETTNTFRLVETFKRHHNKLKESHPFAMAKALFLARRDLALDPTKERAFYQDSMVLVGDWQ